MHIIEQPRARYRLVVRMPGRNIVGENLVFERYKQALAHVAPAIRDHSNGVVPHAIVLQRATDAIELMASDAPEAFGDEDDGAWEEVERWGVPVIQRILAQQTRRIPSRSAAPATVAVIGRHALPAPAAVKPLPVPMPRPQPITVVAPKQPKQPTPPAPAAAQAEPRDERRSVTFAASRRASIFVGVLVVLGVWLGLLALVSGGRPQAVLDAMPGPQMQSAPEVHVDGPGVLATESTATEF